MFYNSGNLSQYNVAPLLTDVVRQTPGDSLPSHECCHGAPHIHDIYIFFFTLLADHCVQVSHRNYETLHKNLQNKLSGSLAVRKQNPCVLCEGQLCTQSKDHQ